MVLICPFAAAEYVAPRESPNTVFPVSGHNGKTTFSFSSLLIASVMFTFPKHGAMYGPIEYKYTRFTALSMAPLVALPGSCYVLSHLMQGEGGMARKPTDTIKLNLRFPEALRRQLEREAKARGQSLNTEIVERLYRSLRQDDKQTDIIAQYLFSALQDEGVLGRILEMAAEDDAAMAAHDEWKERSR
jgi:Arc-like DNA binding domain